MDHLLFVCFRTNNLQITAPFWRAAPSDVDLKRFQTQHGQACILVHVTWSRTFSRATVTIITIIHNLYLYHWHPAYCSALRLPFSCDSFHLFPTYRQCGPRLRLPSLAQRSLKLKYRQNIHECYVICVLFVVHFTVTARISGSIQYSCDHIRYCQLRKNATSHQEALHRCPRQVYAKLGSTEHLGEAVEAVHPVNPGVVSLQVFKTAFCIVLLFSLVMQQFCNWILSRPKLRVAQIVDVVGRCDQVWSAALETYRHSRAWLTQLYPSFSLRRNLECFQWFGRMCWASFPNQVQSRTQLAGLCSMAKQSVFFPFA